jgi:hypothetical protein
MKDISHSLEIAKGLFFLNAAIWLVISLFTFLETLHLYTGQADQKIMVVAILTLTLGNVAAMALSGFFIIKRNKWFYYFAVFVLVINMVLTFTDQFGFWDFATLVIDLILFGVLISIRKQYLSNL